MMHVGGYYDACGGYQEYIRGCWGIPRVHQGMLGGYHEHSGGYHEYIGRCSVHWHVGSKLIKSFKFLLKTPMY